MCWFCNREWSNYTVCSNSKETNKLLDYNSKTHKQLARIEHVHISTIYRRYPVTHTGVTQADVLVLRIHGYSIRDIAGLLQVSKSKVHRLCQ